MCFVASSLDSCGRHGRNSATKHYYRMRAKGTGGGETAAADIWWRLPSVIVISSPSAFVCNNVKFDVQEAPPCTTSPTQRTGACWCRTAIQSIEPDGRPPVLSRSSRSIQEQFSYRFRFRRPAGSAEDGYSRLLWRNLQGGTGDLLSTVHSFRLCADTAFPVLYALMTRKGPFIATQLNSTRRGV